MILPIWARATVVEKVRTSSWHSKDICWILVKEVAYGVEVLPGVRGQSDVFLKVYQDLVVLDRGGE